MYYYNIGDVGTKEITMTDIAIQCTTHDNTSGNIHDCITDLLLN